MRKKKQPTNYKSLNIYLNAFISKKKKKKKKKRKKTPIMRRQNKQKFNLYFMNKREESLKDAFNWI